MKQLILTLSFLLFALNAFSQWKVFKTGKSGFIHDIFILDSKIAYATGDSLFLVTSDGGDTWTDMTDKIPVNSPSFTNVFFITKQTGYLSRSSITGGPTLLRTISSGFAWDDVSSMQISQGAANVFFSDFIVGYATSGVGLGNGIMARSTDGGKNWNRVSAPSPEAASALYFLNDSVGFSGVERLVKTNDGGTTWTPAHTYFDKNNPIVDIVFVSPQIGYALTYNHNIILKTIDGGDNWAQYNTGTSGFLSTHLAFADANTGYISSFMFSKPLVTTNGGVNWAVDTTFPAVTSLTCVAAKNGIVMAGSSDGKIIIRKAGITGMEKASPATVKVFPNPVASGIINIENPAINKLTVVIYDALGKTVATGRDITTRMDITLPAAVYYMHVTDETGNISVSRLAVQE
ncbi:MAG TPA: T9SS type A sorting domain-containing protein [Bacteroidia bacterium]|nr:T9SS type A sorting domain-containing protein [Bacteroidia bacterium]